MSKVAKPLGERAYASGAVMPLLLAALCFAIAAPALIVAFVALHVWLAATILLRLVTGAYVRATLWCCVLAALISIDVSCAPASARYDLPQDYLDALRDAVPNTAAGEIPAHATDCSNRFCSPNEFGQYDKQTWAYETDVPNWWTPTGRGTYWVQNAPTLADAPRWLKYPRQQQRWHTVGRIRRNRL